MRPTPDKFGWWFLALSVVGLGIAAARRRGRATAILAGASLVQMAALNQLAIARGADAPYLALKLFYFLVYLQAAAATLTLAEVFRRVMFHGRMTNAVAWSLLVLLAVRVGRPVAAAPRPVALLSDPVYRAGVWARAHVPPNCVEYLVGHPDTAYWLHLAVLGNPRASSRASRDDTYEPKAAIIRWLTPGGFPYAIAEFSALPRDVRSDLDVVANFDGAAVVKRRGQASCAEGATPQQIR